MTHIRGAPSWDAIPLAGLTCWPASRPIVVLSGLKEPAWVFVVPPVSVGENGSGVGGQVPT